MATLIVRLSREEHRQIKREAKALGQTMSELVRRRMLGPAVVIAETGDPADRPTVAYGVTRGETGASAPKTKREA